MELRFLPKTLSAAASSPSGGGVVGTIVGEGVDGPGGGTILTNNNQGPCSYPPSSIPAHHQQQQQQQQQNHVQQTVGVPLAVVGQEHLMLASMPHRRTLERSMRNLHNGGGVPVVDAQQKMMLDGDCGVTTVGAGVGIVLGAATRNNNTSSSIRRARRGSGSVPGSPRVGRGPSAGAELLQHNSRSPMPIRAASGVKRAARLGRAENMSSGSLNSIEV